MLRGSTATYLARTARKLCGNMRHQPAFPRSATTMRALCCDTGAMFCREGAAFCALLKAERRQTVPGREVPECMVQHAECTWCNPPHLQDDRGGSGDSGGCSLGQSPVCGLRRGYCSDPPVLCPDRHGAMARKFQGP